MEGRNPVKYCSLVKKILFIYRHQSRVCTINSPGGMGSKRATDQIQVDRKILRKYPIRVRVRVKVGVRVKLTM